MADVIEITDNAFESEVVKSSIPVIVDFWAEWCMPCKTISSIVHEIAGEFKGKIKVGKVNIDENIKKATDLGVLNIPTLVFFENGQEAGRVVGVVTKKELLKKIEEIFNV